jgi:short-subunit dehydrogenase
MSTNKPLVLITGASSGIGLELARVFALHQYSLVITARSKNKLETIAQEIKKDFDVEVFTFDLDLAQKGAAQKLLTLCHDANLIPHVLINNAGFGDVGEVLNSNATVIEEMMNLNMISLTLLCRLFGAEMATLADRQETTSAFHIVNIASTAAFLPGPFMAVYYATKAYVLSFTEAFAEELKISKSKISITAICPGPTWSGFQERANLDSSLMIKSPWVMTSKEVAESAFKAILNRRRVYITGWMNWLLTIISHWTPRRINTTIAASINKKRNKESL